mmetsp:Transcript_20849/g.32169  ORF Transcript_20849/g.32169 Transcript_20849/m.32169 type:complete len:298 (-) Transcript_20849:749-1642(-)
MGHRLLALWHLVVLDAQTLEDAMDVRIRHHILVLIRSDRRHLDKLLLLVRKHTWVHLVLQLVDQIIRLQYFHFGTLGLLLGLLVLVFLGGWGRLVNEVDRISENVPAAVCQLRVVLQDLERCFSVQVAEEVELLGGGGLPCREAVDLVHILAEVGSLLGCELELVGFKLSFFFFLFWVGLRVFGFRVFSLGFFRLGLLGFGFYGLVFRRLWLLDSLSFSSWFIFLLLLLCWHHFLFLGLFYFRLFRLNNGVFLLLLLYLPVTFELLLSHSWLALLVRLLLDAFRFYSLLLDLVGFRL